MTSDTARNNGFWKKQFSSTVTTRQLVFDMLFGVVGPLLCIIFDPFVFRSGAFSRGPLADYRVFAYLGIILGILTLTIWLFCGSRIDNTWSGFFAGILLFGALFAGAGGIVLLPFSLLGLLLYGIGALGLIPFVTGFVFLRNGFRALRFKGHMQYPDERLFWGFVVFGFVMIFSIPAFAQWQTSRVEQQGIQLVLNGNDVALKQGVQILKTAFWCDNSCYDKLVEAYMRENDETRRSILARAYQEITGQDIRTILQEMSND